MALFNTDTYRAGLALPVYGPGVFGVFNNRTGGEVERCGSYGDALIRVVFHNQLAARIGIVPQ